MAESEIALSVGDMLGKAAGMEGRSCSPCDAGDNLPVREACPRISVVTPSLNQAGFLDAAIQSVLSQNYANIEYIVIDGGSSDGSVDIIKRHEERISYWVSEKDAGQTQAINKGLARATGEIVSYLNSDDMLEPGALSAISESFRHRPDADVVYGAFCFIDACGRLLHEVMPPPFDRSNLFRGDFISQPATFLRRSCLEEVGGFNEDMHFAMDYDMWLRAAVAGARFVRCAHPIAKMRLHGDSKTVRQECLFPAEVRQSMKRIFSAPHVPSDVASMEDVALGNSFFLEAMSFAALRKMDRSVAACREALARFAAVTDGSWRGFVRRWSAMDMLGQRVPVSIFERRISALRKAEAPDCVIKDCVSYYSEAFRSDAARDSVFRALMMCMRAATSSCVCRWAVRDAIKASLIAARRLRLRPNPRVPPFRG